MGRKSIYEPKVRKLLAKNPEATNNEIAHAVGCSSGYVWKLRAIWDTEPTDEMKSALAMCAHGYSTKEYCHPCAEKLVAELVPESVPTRQEQLTSSVDCILNERAVNYGTFVSQAELSQALKGVLHDALIARGKLLDADQQEALEMVLHKIARVVNGDSNYVDSWSDIAGYATLVAERLQGNIR